MSHAIDKGYEEVQELVEKPTGEYFLARYRQIDPNAELIDPQTISQALRINTVATDPDTLVHQLVRRGAFPEKIPWLKYGYTARARFSLGATPEYLLGHYYLQAPLSQLACEVLNPSPGSDVLDMAAAPGGKTTYLAAMVGSGKRPGIVVALDSDAVRLASVRNNVERLRLHNVVCVRKDARFAMDLKRTFAYVLLDAPCSGNYCSEDGWLGKRTIEHIKSNARTQRELIRAAYLCLAPGGRLLYSTCSLEPEEDELIIDFALKKFPDLTVVPLEHVPLGDAGAVTWEGKELDPRIAGTRRFWPHKTGQEGFFIALLEKKR
jgi:NOL1/NOP2/sun family putative RNA methylase